MKIDLHAHFIPRDCFDMTDSQGRVFGPHIGRDQNGNEVLIVDGVNLGRIVSQIYDPARRIRDMDQIGLDMQAVSIAPNSFWYDMEAGEALKIARKYNDAVMEWVRAYPDRFVGVATLPMQDIGLAIVEMERAIRIGMKAIQINSNINGKNLDEPEFWPFYANAQALDIPVFVHPWRVAGAERMKRYFLINIVGNPLETAIAVASVIFGGVMRDFPKLKLIFAHAGGAAPFIRGRWQHGYDFVSECRSIPKSLDDYFNALYFDTVAHSDSALAYLVKTVGADKVVLGSDYPFEMGDVDPVSTVRNANGITKRDKDKILERTSASLLKL